MSNEAQSLVRKLGGSGDFSSSQIMVLLLLADHADEKWECWPSLALLCHHSQFSERTVRSSIKALREKGVLSVREQRSQATGARLENRYRLNKSTIEPFALKGVQLWERLKSKRAIRSAAIRSTPIPISAEPDGFMANGPSYGVLVATEEYPANTAGHVKPLVSAPENTTGYPPAKFAGHTDARQMTTEYPANDDQKPVVPFKGTRADLTINHQSSISSPAPKASERIKTDNEKNDDDDQNLNGSMTVQIHRGVNLVELFDLIPEQLKSLNTTQIRRLIDLVLARAGANPVKSPLRYVAKACTQDPAGLRWFVSEPEAKLMASFEESTDAISAPVQSTITEIAECKNHFWAHKNPDAICPGCAADSLAIPEPGEHRPAKPKRGEFRTDIGVKASTDGATTETTDLPWGPNDEPGF